MKSAVFFGLLTALLVSADVTPHKNLVIGHKYIVEVDNVSSLSRRGQDLHPLDAVYHEFNSRSIPYQITREFKSEGIFNGAAIIVESPEHVTQIQNTPGVVAIRPMRYYPQPSPKKVYIPKGVRDASVPSDPFSTHILGGVSKVHAEGNIGTGVKIGIIDTGVDYTNPYLGSDGTYGPGHKIAIGYDYAGNSFNGSNTPTPSSNPMDCAGHGTHVAGIIAADPKNPYNISGVAYGATIGAYKIFGCTGGTSDDLIIDALLQGAKDGMDVLTLSLGGPDGWATSASSVVASRIAASGKVVTIAAGNDGAEGSWYASSPGSGTDVIAVGSVDNTVYPLQNATVSGVNHPPITYFSALPLNVTGALPIYATSTNTSVEDDACSALPADTPDLSKYLVIIRRGTCTFVSKLANAAAKGAKAMLIYDNGRGFDSIETGNYTAALIQSDDGEFLVNEFAAKAPITVTFPQVGGSTNLPNSNGGLMSSFSSYGPTFDFLFKPAFSTPGGNILSTYLVSQGGFAVLSGTSMATPFAAGSAALLLAAKGRTAAVANGARTLFETTSTKIVNATGDPAFNTLSQTGAGLINVYNAIHATSLVSPGELILNDTTHFQGQHTVTIQNTANVSQQYTVAHVPALTALTMKPDDVNAALGPLPLVSDPATVTISPSSFTINPGASQQVVVTFKAPTGQPAVLYPVYSGFVEVTTKLQSFHVSYLGLAASLKDHPLFDNTTTVLPYTSPALVNQAGTNLVQATNFTFQGQDFPSINWRLVVGTPLLTIDLVDPKIQFSPTISARGLVGSDALAFSPDDFARGLEARDAKAGSPFSAVKVIGNLFSQTYLARNNEILDPTNEDVNGFDNLALQLPQFANGSTIANGQYRILVRALRITGDPTSEADYDSWLSPIIGINA